MMLHSLCLAIFGMLLTSCTAAAHVVLEDIQTGYWNSSGAYCSNLPFAGAGDAGGSCRATFIFDLAEVEGRVQSGFLRLDIEGFWSSAETECFVLYDVTSPIEDVLAGIHSTDIWEDLGDGKIYSDQFCLTHADEGLLVEIPLSRKAIQDLNKRDLFPIGITSTTVDGSKEEDIEGARFGFGDISQWTNELVLEVAPLRCGPWVTRLGWRP